MQKKNIELILHIHGGFYLASTKGSFTREIKNVVCRSLLRFYFVGGRIHNNLFFEAFNLAQKARVFVPGRAVQYRLVFFW